MLRKPKFFKNKKAQNTAEYAILISLVVAGIIAMQTYAQRALQARVRDAAVWMANAASGQGVGNMLQYEPYYLSTNYEQKRAEEETQLLGTNVVSQEVNSVRTRLKGGRTISTYNGTVAP